ncbi:TOM1-like protein 2-like, partial [Trifolium medium]|nr:TOM1-like protein 2-like [Trifolium medium]
QSAGVQFPQRAQIVQSNRPSSTPNRTDNVPKKEQVPLRHEGVPQKAESNIVPESSIIQKASNVLEILKEVLDAVDAKHPQGASDEFTLDLVEQCSFQKQRVMHLVMASR